MQSDGNTSRDQPGFGEEERWSNPLFMSCGSSRNGDRLCRQLPVVTVRQWEEVTEAALRRWHAELAPLFDSRDVEGVVETALSMQAWVAKLRSHGSREV